jgi:hypothetical protein
MEDRPTTSRSVIGGHEIVSTGEPEGGQETWTTVGLKEALWTTPIMVLAAIT